MGRVYFPFMCRKMGACESIKNAMTPSYGFGSQSSTPHFSPLLSNAPRKSDNQHPRLDIYALLFFVILFFLFLFTPVSFLFSSRQPPFPVVLHPFPCL